jgi:hypothetical protein
MGRPGWPTLAASGEQLTAALTVDRDGSRHFPQPSRQEAAESRRAAQRGLLLERARSPHEAPRTAPAAELTDTSFA